MKDVLQKQLSLREKQQSESRSAIERYLYKFKTEFVEETMELDSKYEALEGYLELKKRIEQDDLPRHEKRFKALMNDKIVVAISLFKNNLVNKEEEIKAAIDDLNRPSDWLTTQTQRILSCDMTPPAQ